MIQLDPESVLLFSQAFEVSVEARGVIMKKLSALITLAPALFMLAGCTGQVEQCIQDQDGECQAPVEATGNQENTDSTQQALTFKSRTFYVSNPKSAANKYTGKSKALRVTATIPSGNRLYDINFMQSIWAIDGVSCSGTYCSATRTLYGCQNYGTIPVTVDYAGAGTPSLSYWFTDCY